MAMMTPVTSTTAPMIGMRMAAPMTPVLMMPEAAIGAVVKKVGKAAVKAAANGVAEQSGKKAAKDIAKDALKKGVREGAKKARSMYTEAERKELQRLRSQKSYWKKKMQKESSDEDDKNIFKVPLSMVRGQISESLAYDIKYTDIYFEPVNETVYSTRDFREWMVSNGDEKLVDRILKEAVITLPAGIMADKIKDAYAKYKAVEQKIEKIKSAARARQIKSALANIDTAKKAKTVGKAALKVAEVIL